MGEPAQQQRKQLGLIVLAFLAVFFVVAYYLKKEFWKDIH
jgi:ubiquinol-cytochrome c reductase cytochrome c1 subunit